MQITQKDISNVCFNDYPIESMVLSELLKLFEIKIKGAHFKQKGKWINLGQGTITISSWRSLSISLYDSKKKKWVNLDEKNYDPLLEICEFELNETLVLSGFGKKTHQWVQYVFSSPMLNIYFLE